MKRKFVLFVFLITAPVLSMAQLSDTDMRALELEFLKYFVTNPLNAADVPKLYQVRSELGGALKDPSLANSSDNWIVAKNRNTVFSANNCLADNAVKTFIDLARAKKSPYGFLGPRDFPQDKSGNPLLNARTKSTDEFPQDGWVWSTALRASHGNPNLAMNGLSAWTHDDRSKILELESSENLSPETLRELNEFKKECFKIVSKAGVDPASLEDAIKLEGRPFRLSGLMLPKEILLPGSLGKDVDISEKLKTKIAQVQAPKLGASALPAKYYQVLAGAQLGCLLKQKGISTETSAMAAQKIAEIYRAKRLCKEVTSMDKDQELLSQKFKDSKLKIPFEDFLENEAKELAKTCLKDAQTGRMPGLGEPCRLAYGAFGSMAPLYKAIEFNQKLSDQERKLKIKRMMDRMNASAMLIKYAQSTGRNPNYCEESLKVFGDLQAANEKWCARLNPDDCDRALQVIRTWVIDFEWTIAQQEVGAKFGATQCTPLGSESLNELCLRVSKTQDENPQKGLR